MIPFPVDNLVRILLQTHAPNVLPKLEWDQVWLQPSAGLHFSELKIQVRPGLHVIAPRAFVRFSWARLLRLETRIDAVEARVLRIDWDLQGDNADGDLDYAAPTESHLAEIKSALDSLQRILSPQQVQLRSHEWLILTNHDTLRIYNPRLTVIPNNNAWDLRLQSDVVQIADWPLPTKLKAKLLLSDSNMVLRNLSACWSKGCLEGEGTLGKGQKLSKLNLQLHNISLAPFGSFAVPDPAGWKGKASGKITWKGRIARPETWEADGKLEMENVVFSDWPFQREGTFAEFVPIYRKKLEIDQIEIPEFHLEKNRVRVDSMTVSGDGIDAIAQGSWYFPQRLDFRLHGTLSEDVCEDLPHLTRLALPKTKDGGGSFKATLAGTFRWQALTPDAEHYGTVLRNIF